MEADAAGVDQALWQAAQRVIASPNLEAALIASVQAAAALSQAAQTRLFLTSPAGELILRASFTAGEAQAALLHLPNQEPEAQQALASGQVTRRSASAHPAGALFFPIFAQGQALGVLAVEGSPPDNEQVSRVARLLEVAGEIIWNAQRYADSERARLQLITAIEGLEDGVLLFDENGRLALANCRGRAMFNLEPACQPGKPAQRLIANPDIQALLSKGAPNGPRRLEITLEDGRVMNCQCSPIAGVGLAIVLQDITDLKELDRVKSDFVSAVSHDLRSPLTAILGYADLVERVGPATPQQHDFLQRIQLSVRNITALINDLLELGQIETGFDGRMEIVQLAALVSFIIEEQQNRFQEKRQTVTLDLPANLPPVSGNPVHLRQLLTNLVGNANKYTPAAGRIMVSASTREDQVIVQVSDDGPGIPPGEQAHIFEKFYRASNVPGDVPGTGLGLAIVKSIVEKHHGRIWVDSILGKGAKFTLVLPVANGR